MGSLHAYPLWLWVGTKGLSSIPTPYPSHHAREVLLECEKFLETEVDQTYVQLNIVLRLSW